METVKCEKYNAEPVYEEQPEEEQPEEQLQQQEENLDDHEDEEELPMLTPNKVGDEFVRQYYRMLYKVPEMVHRFYMNDSTCTHHDYRMVVGKQNIQYLFQRENYRKCRTRIFNTDIHGTIANGVIVLVTGEQSNAGLPMRPFVQTFVLAAAGPRTYYVSNDIFRYADVFEKTPSLVDVECQTSSMHIGDGDCRETLEPSIEHVDRTATSSTAPVYDFYKSTGEGSCAIPMPRWASARPSRDSSMSGSFTHTFTQQESFTVHSDGINSVDENMTMNDYTPQEQQQQIGEFPYYRSMIAQALSPRMEFEDITPMNQQYVNTVYYDEEVTRTSVGVSSVRPAKRRGDTQNQYTRSNNEDQANSLQQSSESQESAAPTYAKLFMNAFTRASMKNNNQIASSISSPMKATAMPNIYNANRSNNQTSTTTTLSNTTASNQAMHAVNQAENNFATVHSQGYTPVQRNNYSNGIRRNERRRSSSSQKYEDNQQLFLGQIPHNATEDELISIFSCFGNVLELRILPNLNGKIQPGAKHPLKYGFLTFEHVESVKACLESRPVYFPNNSPDGQKLNVRAKKPSVARDDVPSLDSQSIGTDWLKATTRRNNSVSSNSTNGGGGGASGGTNVVNGSAGSPNNIFNRKDNRNGRAASLDSAPAATAAAPNSGGRKLPQTIGSGVVNGCGRR